jgi:acetyl-CoA carboxylase biotin carboxyl carrier protein
LPVHLVKAPLLGVAYRSREPGAAPFVEVGDTVEQGATLCLVEAMKMFNEIVSPVSGIISEIHVVDGELVEHGAPLFSLQVHA